MREIFAVLIGPMIISAVISTTEIDSDRQWVEESIEWIKTVEYSIQVKFDRVTGDPFTAK